MNSTLASGTVRTGLSAAFALALAGAALGQSAPDVPIPPATPINSVTSVSSSWSMTQSVDGRTISVSSKDGKLAAEVDGKPVPDDRIIEKNGSVRIKDDKGETIFESAVPGNETSVRFGNGSFPSRASLGTRLGNTYSVGPRIKGGMLTLNNPTDHTIHITADAPKVMVGVQLLEPDSSLRGHLGLKEDETTLISAVYEGLPAAQAGLEPYDIIIAVNGKSPAAPEAVRKALRETDPGKTVSLDILHRGAKKTVTITVEKYDEDKLEKAKVNAIAAASGAPSAVAIGGDPNDPVARSWGWGANAGGGNPFVATLPGTPGQPNKSITLWGHAGADQEEMAKRLQALAERAQEQASRADEQVKRLRDQMMSGAAGGQNMIDLNRVMEDRMKKMEEMMQKMMEQRNAPPAPAAKKEENKS